jgi:hypothetical protein
VALWLLAAAPSPEQAAWASQCEAVLARVQAAPAGADLRPLMATLALPPVAGQPGHLAALDEAARRLTQADEARDVAAARRARGEAEEALAATCAHARRQLDAPPAALSRAELDEILGRPQFHARKGSQWLLARIGARLLELLKDFLQARGFQTFSQATSVVFLVTVGLAVTLLAVRLWRARRPRAPGALEVGPVAVRTALLASAQALAAQAEQALGRGDAREAFRLGMASLRRAWEEARWADRVQAATDRELPALLQQRRAPDAWVQRTQALGQDFEQAFYGGVGLTPEAAARFVRDAVTLGRELRPAPEAP